MSRNISDKESVKKQDGDIKLKRLSEMNDVKFLLNNPEGIRYLWRLLERCNVFSLSFTGSSDTFFKEGRRDIGLKILNDITEADPMAFVEMMKGFNRKESND